MDSIIITPNVGIGPFRLGMCKEEVEQTFRNLDHWRANDGILGNPSYIEMLFIREHFEYDANERVRFIQLINPHYSGHFCIPCLFQGVDVFKTKAEDLIHTFKKKYPMVGDVDPRTGFSFAIQELELCFWREGIMNDEIMKDPDFLEMSEENQELEKRYFYFTTVSIGAGGYFDFMVDSPS
ncbi:hypothetical protein ABEW19_10790 [Paenibacillus illinoisensis]|uniref:hypothetical protein n=1 Tax=Paenibacillus illinoisensis TaxID=59845 RepID=UPI003D2C89C6